MAGSQKTIPSKANQLRLMIVPVLTFDSDEHQRRSPDCVFFAYSTTIEKKSGRTKQGRASKASRMSTQSNFTTVSEGVSVADTDAHGDDSIIPVVEPVKTAKSGKGAKKGAKAKKPAAKSKRKVSKATDENTPVASSFLEPEDDDFEVKVDTVLTQSKENKKRKSDGMSIATNSAEAHNEKEDSQDQPRKRRATRTTGSMAQTRNAPSPAPQEEHDHDAPKTDAEVIPSPAPPQGRKNGKSGNKRGSSNVRKVSTASTASKASLRAIIPPDEDIDAVLEAELNRPLTDEEGDIKSPAMNIPKGRRLTKTRPGSRKATASVAPTRRTTRASTVTVEDLTMQDVYPSLPEPVVEAHVPTLKKNEHDALALDTPDQSPPPEHQKRERTPEISEQHIRYNEKTEKLDEAGNDKVDEEMPTLEPQQPRSRQASRKLPARSTRVLDIPRSSEAMDLASDINSSMLGTQTAHDDSGHETDASVVKPARTKRSSKKVPAKKMKGGKKAALMSQNIEDIVQPLMDEASHDEQGTLAGPVDDYTVNVPVEVKEPEKQRKPSRTTAKSGKTKKTLPEPEAFAREESVAPLMKQPSPLAEGAIARPSTQPLSAHATPRPAPSPQSSDAENQPPSSCLSKRNPPLTLQSPLKAQLNRVPLAVTTPISSPSRNNVSKLQTIFPWTTVDLEHVFESTPTRGQENNPLILGEAGGPDKSLLTSPEKKLTVEQWIHSNGQRGEEKLRNECERLVGKFEDQGVRALRVLEGIVCAERP